MTARLLLPLLLTMAFTLAARLDGWRESWDGTALRSGNLMAMVFGDSRRMFANHFFVKADVYFHSGYYPSIFDDQKAYQTPHMTEDAGAVEGANPTSDHTFREASENWIDRFSRRFVPDQHTHLEGIPGAAEGGASEAHAEEGEADEHGHGHGHDGCAVCAAAQGGGDADDVEAESEGGAVKGAGGGLVSEMLPWLRVSVALDPHRVESYVTTAYWLRERLGNSVEAERFLREGLVSNPNSGELYFELGRIAFEDHRDVERARHLWRTGLKKWEISEGGKAEPDLFIKRQLLAFLARADEESGDFASAYEHLLGAKEASGGSNLFEARLTRLRGLLGQSDAPDL